MKKSLIRALLLVGVCLLFSPAQASAQSGYTYSEVGYNSAARFTFGYSETWIDYDLYTFYDPAVKSDLYRANEEIPLDGGYTQGATEAFGGGYAATISTFAGPHHYRPSTRYTTVSTHFIIPVYDYSPPHCYSYGFASHCFADPWGLGFLPGGGLYGGFWGFNPGGLFNPYRFIAFRTKIVGRHVVSITTPADGQPPPPPPPPNPSCSSNGRGGAAANNFASTASTTNVCTPQQTHVEVWIDPGHLRPAGTTGGQNTATVNVRVTPAQPVRSVTLRLAGETGTGGHVDAQHNGTRPAGRLRQTQGTTDPSGMFRVSYTPSHIAGRVKVTANVAGVELDVFAHVMVPGLQELFGGANYNLIGQTGSHPSNHWGTPGANSGLVGIADDYKNEYYRNVAIPDADKIAYNDQSLTWGGKFELANRWNATGSHAEHREGINCDIRSNNIPHDRRTKLNEIFFNRGSTRTLDETGTSSPHWHARFEFGGGQAAVGRNTGNFVEESIWGALDREPNYAEWQDWTNKLTNVQVQGQQPMIEGTRAYLRSLFKSAEYLGRGTSDETYVADLYRAYLLREPEAHGFNAWLNALRNWNAQGADGRELTLQGFEYSQEFVNLVTSLEMVPLEVPSPTPRPTPPCPDNDGDGYCSDQDCNDWDATVFPGASSYCTSGEDRNCNSQDDYSECYGYGCGPYGCY